MKCYFHLQHWDTMLVGDIETTWLKFKTVLLEFVENFHPPPGSVKAPTSKTMGIETYCCDAKAEEKTA